MAAQTYRSRTAPLAPNLRFAFGLILLLAGESATDAAERATGNPLSAVSDQPAELLSVPAASRTAVVNRQAVDSQAVEDRLRLGRGGASPTGRIDSVSKGPQVGPAVPIVTVVSSLAVVIGLFAALVWVSRKSMRSSAAGRVLPDEALKVLGQKPLGGGSSIMLVRCGRGVMVVGISPAGMHPIAHLTDQDEVRHLEAICGTGGAASFGETLQSMRLEPAPRERVHAAGSRQSARSRLFAEA